MEKLTSTKHLELYISTEQGDNNFYLIFEKGAKMPIMACGKKGKLTHLSKTIPLLIEDYKYYSEVENLIGQAIIAEKLAGVR